MKKKHSYFSLIKLIALSVLLLPGPLFGFSHFVKPGVENLTDPCSIEVENINPYNSTETSTILSTVRLQEDVSKGVTTTESASSVDPNFHIYLCFGQSNMEGAGDIEAQDQTVDDRFQILQAVDCSGRSREVWRTASPPLCRCYSKLGPADYFGRVMVENLPSNVKVGIVHVAVAGCKIELFDKENYESYAAEQADWMKTIIAGYGGNPYGRLVELAKLAQKDGVIKGILLHQGESNTGDQSWPDKVNLVYANLLIDLGLEAGSVPLLAGQLVDAEQGGACASMNTIINKLPNTIPTAHVISSSGCAGKDDNLHFTSAGNRLLGERYALKMLSLLTQSGLNVAITSPKNNAIYPTPASVSITADATCSSGSVKSVAFYVNGTLISTDNTAPYTATFNESAMGSYAIISVATDSNGESITSGVKTIHIIDPQAMSDISVRAKGVEGTELLELMVDDVVLDTWTMGTSYQTYTYSSGPSSGVFKLNYTNDNTGRDIQVDYLEVGGITYQAEDQVVNTAFYANGECGGGSNSEMMHCNGYIQFNVGVACADSDGDGTDDCSDGCPNDANKTAPGICGCGVAEGTCSQSSKIQWAIPGGNQGLGACKAKFLGNIIPGSVRSDFGDYWNQVTPENAGKWGSVESSRNNYNWGNLDLIYNYAQTHDIPFKQHVFIWGNQQPNWLAALSDEDKRAEVEEWFSLYAQRYPNTDIIDVANESIRNHAATVAVADALGGNNNGDNIPYLKENETKYGPYGTGWDYIIYAFAKARHYFPNSILVLNDYGIINDASAITEHLAVVKILKDRGLIDAVGIQCHTFNIDNMSASQVKTNLDKIAKGGLPIHVTELDIVANQASKYEELFPVFYEHPAVAGVTLWGYVEGQTWKTGSGILNSDGSEKAAMKWLKQYMNAQPDVCNSNAKPVVSITSPTNGASFVKPSSITVSATASDSDGTIAHVEFFQGTTSLGVDNSAPYAVSWEDVAVGEYVITAIATDDDGATTTSSAVSISVSADNVAVTGVSVSPATETVAVGSTVHLLATLSPGNASNKAVSWSSGNTSVATVNSEGVVTGISEGSATITVTTADGNKTATAAITVSGGSANTPCENPVSISIPFAQDGVGEYCWVTTDEIAYVNSWNMIELTINGVDYTNKWSDDLPASVNGEWVIYYRGDVAWAHFEAPDLKNAVINSEQSEHHSAFEVQMYPNPTHSVLTIEFSHELTESALIQLFDCTGRLIKTYKVQGTQQNINIDSLPSGLYMVKVSNSTESIVKRMMKK